MKDLTEESCSILAHPDISANNIANSTMFLSTNRIKQWKPKNLTKLDPNKTYCYIDHDEKNSIQDITMAGEGKCTRLARNVPFIDRTFEDNELDNARTFPHNKCVIEIDPKKIDGPSANTFWRQISELHCDGIKEEIFRENKVLEAELAKNMKDISVLTAEIAKQNNTIGVKKKEKDELQRLLRKATERTSFLQSVIAKVNEKLTQVTSDFKSYTSTFEKNKKEYSEHIENREREIIQFRKDIETFEARMLELEKEALRFKRLLSEVTQAYDIGVVDLEKLKAQIVALDREIGNMRIALEKCRKDLVKMRVLLNKCNTETVETEKNILDTHAAFVECKRLHNICLAELEKIMVRIREVKEDYKFFYAKYIPCVNELLPTCKSDLAEKTKLWNNEKKNHKAWNDLPHYSCAGELTSKEVSDLEWDRNKQTCENTQRDKQQTYDKYIHLLSIEYQNRLNKIQACFNNKYNVRPFESAPFNFGIPNIPPIPYPEFASECYVQEPGHLHQNCPLFMVVPWETSHKGWVYSGTPPFSVAANMNVSVHGGVNDYILVYLWTNGVRNWEKGWWGKGRYEFSLNFTPGNTYQFRMAFNNTKAKGFIHVDGLSGYNPGLICRPVRIS